MAESFSSKLQIWDGWAPSMIKGSVAAAPGERGLGGPRNSNDYANRLYEQESLYCGARPRAWAEPFSLQWYLDVENARHGRYGRWIPRLLEFTKHAGERLLGLGDGLGTDWVQYAHHGAAVTTVCSSAEGMALVQRNFELRGLRGTFLHADAIALPVEAASVDVVCFSGLLTAQPAASLVIEEIYRVLKPGGKVLALAHARFDISFWRQRFLPWYAWLRLLRATPSSTQGLSSRGLRHLCGRFIEPRVHKRHLRRREVPHLWRWLPHPVLERLFGRFLLLKAFKPLSTAMAVPAAA